MSDNKQISKYNPETEHYIEVGAYAFIECVDHPLMGTKRVRTSVVESFDKDTGVFETKNTIYSPEINYA